MALSPELKDWAELADMFEANATLTFKVPDGTVTYDPETGNSIFSQRSITIRAYLYESEALVNRGVKDESVGVDSLEKQLVGFVLGVADPLDPTLPQRLLPPGVADMSSCTVAIDYPAGLKRTGTGALRIEQLDIFEIDKAFGEFFYLRFIPDRARRD